jgi:outer membrane protein OmpA-like peptidoglycan-associated protein
LSPWLAVPIGLVSLTAATIGGCAIIEHDLTERTTQALDDAGLTVVDVDFHYRTATLEGPEGLGDRALDVARNVNGIRSDDVRYVTRSDSAPLDDATLMTTAAAVPTLATTAPISSDPSVSSSAGPDTTGASSTASSAAPDTTAAVTTTVTSEPDPFADLTFNFDDGVSSLGEDAVSLVARVADICREALAAAPGSKVQLSGHADDTGDAAINERLSEERAVAVRDALAEKGVDPNRLVVMFFGDSEPLASGGTDEGRYINRRVEIELLEAAP